MFGHNLGVHINHAPSGRWCFVGTLPRRLGDVVKADKAALLGGRAFDNGSGGYAMLKFPTFETAAEARQHAADRNVEVNN